MTAVLEPQTSSADLLVLLDVGELRPSPANPRRSVEDIDELAASIATLGIVEPLIVTPAAGGGYDLVAGHRRLAAARKAGIEAVPCVVRQDLDERSAAELRLVENLHRQDLSAMEEAAAYKGLIALGYSQRQLAKQIGRSQAHISRRLGLLLLPAPAQEALDSGRITIEQATVLARMHDDPERVARVLEVGDRQIDNYLRHHLTEYANAKARAKVVAELEEKGVRIQAGYSGRQRLNFGDVGVTVDEEAHATEPCHAVTVAADGRVDTICTDRDRHGPAGASTLKASNMVEHAPAHVEVRSQPGPAGERRPVDPKVQAEAAAAQERATARAEAAAARAEHVRDLIISPLGGGGTEMIRLFLEMWLVTVNEVPPVLAACALLGLDGGAGDESAADQLRLHADQPVNDARPRARWQAALALAVATGEESLRLGNYQDGLGEDDALAGRVYLDWLAHTGYRLSDVERDLVAAAGAPLDEVKSDDPAVDTGGVTITVKKSGKKWKVSCSACGDIGSQTTEAYADQRGRDHVALDHALVGAEVAP